MFMKQQLKNGKFSSPMFWSSQGKIEVKALGLGR